VSRRPTAAAPVLACAVLACAVLACAGLMAGCGSQPPGVTGADPPPLTAPLSTSLVTAQGTWAVAVMGGPDADDKFWQLFLRHGTSGRCALVTPQGVADNGRLVAPPGTGTLAAGGGGSYDALAVAGSRLTVWRLARGAWAKVQQITVPVQPGSSG